MTKLRRRKEAKASRSREYHWREDRKQQILGKLNEGLTEGVKEDNKIDKINRKEEGRGKEQDKDE